MRSPFLQIIYFEYYVRFSSVDEKKRLKREIQAHNGWRRKYARSDLVFPFVVLCIDRSIFVVGLAVVNID